MRRDSPFDRGGGSGDSNGDEGERGNTDRCVELHAVEFSPDAGSFALVFAEPGGAIHRMQMPAWAAHQLARALPRVGVPVESAWPVRGAGDTANAAG